MKRWFVLLAAVMLCCVPSLGIGHAAAPIASEQPDPPLMAYYYQWFDAGSWRRGKIDLPVLGPYSSDDHRVVRQHIRQAKAAGIDGFITSWKDTPKNDRRLELLMRVAKSEDFRLAMIYQGLDFGRRPLPTDRVLADFRTFRDRYASDPVFLRLGGRPLTILSGTWRFSHRDVARVTSAVRRDLLVLATERNVDGYRRIANVTDGDAYYWSSLNPETYPDSEGKLCDMARAVHADGKYWIAPFAPGFDARRVGGRSSVPRRDGRTLRTEYTAAVASAPDVLGLISWNEFSENTHVEPSRSFGTRYLQVLRELHGGPNLPPTARVGDSSDGTGAPSVERVVLVTAGIGVPVVLIACAAARRRKQSRGVSG
ncbi:MULTISPECIES: endo-1,3-alpha-glucanase family glycosylhydrolase [unclassified Streptomyces]|uniref:endo-1,3-alpha-glucanase family glycosylhydrolase n=1 Tax=unclassified Streptomyces TaxID=2593676 RepID=UPI002365210D|nr:MULTISPECIES: endo-1,3-alpha-glucanase family glycosylhydrolase [unclassified Streptomyces]MDF3143069.1 endo-1,3-alpha-glucanase family glycosylhydrolase [Streptomyces sp. T21Q-yed]WDF43026.1 endo-1,3-alpha-glucanase family glycosylhydrolase [Streptomyces sp. T12]